jgi:hypothetical protein
MVLIAALILAACGEGAGGGPSGAAKAWFEALTQFDMAKMTDLTCESEKASIDSALSGLGGEGFDLEGLKDLFQIDVSGLSFQDQSVSGNNATVRVSGKLKISAFGQSQEEDVNEDIPLVNEGGTWKVCTGEVPLN